MSEIDQPQACMMLSEYLQLQTIETGAETIEAFVISLNDGETPNMALSMAKRCLDGNADKTWSVYQ